MLFDPSQIKAMREALFTAEQTLQLSPSCSPDAEAREALAKVIVAAVVHGHRNPLVIASLALRTFNARSAA